MTTPPKNPDALVRYGLNWEGHDHAIVEPMPDGYWTPWHVAQKLLNDSVIPDGWVLVPREPTEEMLLRAGKTPDGVSCRGGIDWLGKMLPKYYKAMLSAAPKCEGGG
jgi:hypothetical protein